MNIFNSTQSLSYDLSNITNKMEQVCTTNDNKEICITLCEMPLLKTKEETTCCIQFIMYKLQEVLSIKDRVDINIYITKDIKMEMFKTIHLFFDIFKRELPNKLNKCKIYTKAKYKGMASMLLTFADKETKSRMEILNHSIIT
jgi:hypothetical protein